MGGSDASLLGSAADVLLRLQSGVVAQIQLGAVGHGLVVVQNGGAGLSLEVNTVLVLVGHLGNLDLDLGMLVDGVRNFFLLVLWYVNLPLMVERYLPVSVGYLECLVFLAKFRNELSQEVVGFEVREEGVGSALILPVLLGLEADDGHVVMLR